jgi:hypothetical protein
MRTEVLDQEQEVGKSLVTISKEEHKVVIRLNSGEVVKGHIEVNGRDLTPSLVSPDLGSSAVVFVRTLGTKDSLPVQLQDIKAIFIVKSFRGDPKRKGVRFYSNGPAVGSIWVEVQFKDNEIMEGLIENSVQHLLGDGLLLKPSDPGTNNIAIYLNKASIASYRVLGVRAASSK